ncbi:hypothetical protein [Variovorax sp. OV329]|uniref:hypothetical protein n=1 Tax=Variovorax sp. OV329 TaxID=1882825 RepID=UPI0008E11CAB|nr:hypothetical protein [Variovorax sp. OV329]SFM64062.1 hypothetical protein SAMN05444747_107107 [Variovorax sp. OV329]
MDVGDFETADDAAELLACNTRRFIQDWQHREHPTDSDFSELWGGVPALGGRHNPGMPRELFIPSSGAPAGSALARGG